MRDPGGDTSGSYGPYGTACRSDMLSASISIGNISDALIEAEKLIGAQTWFGMTADQWCQGPWNDAKQAFYNLRDAVERAQNDCIAAADKLDQDPNAVKNYGR